MISDKLQSLLTDQVVSLINNAKVGLGGNSTYGSQTDLDNVLSSASVSAIKSDENVIQVKVSVTGGGALTGQVIREVGVFDSSSNMLLRENFEGVGPFASNETTEFFIFLEVE